MQKVRTYVDTSVFGGVYDEEFYSASEQFFKRAREGSFTVIISEITLEELGSAPQNVRKVFEDLPADIVLEVPVDKEVFQLAQKYIDNQILAEKWIGDAMHVAAATISHADLIVSWNFKHIVNYDKIRKFNSVNLFLGYPQLDIRSPLEVIYE